jgi:hypothetical protein
MVEMIRLRYILITIILTLCSVLSVGAQEILPRIGSLAENREYMNLLRRERALEVKSDSVVGVMSSIRSQIRAMAVQDTIPAAADSLAVVLTSADQVMYQIRAEKLQLVDSINAIEQQHVLSRMDNNRSAVASSSSSIFNNEYLRQSLPEEDYVSLLRVHAMEPDVRAKVRQYSEGYIRIKSLYDKYLMSAVEGEAGALYEELTAAMAANDALNREIAQAWGEIFDQKTYVYSYFLEKENRVDVLNITEGMMRDAQLKIANDVEGCMSEALVDYCLQKNVVLNFETYVARLLNAQSSLDSLSKDSRIHRELDYRLPNFEVERRSFVQYEPIQFHAKSPYNSQNPVPECVVYEYGTIYRLLLGSYKYEQNLNIFKGIAPLYIKQEEDGRYYYYAGGFRTKSEAVAAEGILRKKNFRNPQIIEWCNGQMTNITALGEEGEYHYRIEIEGVEKLSDLTLSVIRDNAPDCQLSKVGDTSFILGSFDSQAVAKQVAESVQHSDEMLQIKVAVIGEESQDEAFEESDDVTEQTVAEDATEEETKTEEAAATNPEVVSDVNTDTETGTVTDLEPETETSTVTEVEPDVDDKTEIAVEEDATSEPEPVIETETVAEPTTEAEVTSEVEVASEIQE